ncbi:hypothetical protein ACVWWR_003152 [Bradyrhizobium sp. LM3.2]
MMSAKKIELRPIPRLDSPALNAATKITQPISASHSRFHSSQSGPKIIAQKWKPSRTKTNLSVARRSAPAGEGA